MKCRPVINCCFYCFEAFILRMYILRNMKNLIFLVLTALCFSITLKAQIQDAAKIFGTVSDPNGAVIVGTQVSLRGAAERSAITNKDGFFTFENLPRGDYELKVTTKGFSPQTLNFSIADQNKNFDIRMQIGKSQITVTAEIGQEVDRVKVSQAVTIIDQNEISQRSTAILAQAVVR